MQLIIYLKNACVLNQFERYILLNQFTCLVHTNSCHTQADFAFPGVCSSRCGSGGGGQNFRKVT